MHNKNCCILFHGLLTFNVDCEFLVGGVGRPQPCSQGFLYSSPVEELQQSGFRGWESFCCFPSSSSECLLLCMCASCVWTSVTSHRVKWNPQRKKTFSFIFSLSFTFIFLIGVRIFYFCSMKSPRGFLRTFSYTRHTLSVSPAHLWIRTESWMEKRRRQ